MLIGQVIELRRAFDFLMTQPGVDSKRLGFVGHYESATYGGALAGVEKRAKAYFLVTGWPSFAPMIKAICCYDTQSITTDMILPYVKDIDTLDFVTHAAPASHFFQYRKNEPTITEDLVNQFNAATSQPKQIERYEDYTMNTDPVVKARQAWLIEQLTLAP